MCPNGHPVEPCGHPVKEFGIGSGTDRLGSNWWLQGLVINLQLKI